MNLIDFHSKIDRRGPDECWPWLAARTAKGYGWVRMAGKNEHAHRVALSISLGRPVAADRMALHHCDNPPCCNPAHLYEGTAADNVRDTVERGRHRAQTGAFRRLLSQVGSGRKLEAQQVVEIRRRIADGEPGTRIAADYGVSEGGIRLIGKRRTWRYVA